MRMATPTTTAMPMVEGGRPISAHRLVDISNEMVQAEAQIQHLAFLENREIVKILIESFTITWDLAETVANS